MGGAWQPRLLLDLLPKVFMMCSPCGHSCISINAKPVRMLLLTEEISPIKPNDVAMCYSCRTPAPPISMLIRAASLPGSRGRVNYLNFANGLRNECHNIEIGGAGGESTMSDALTIRCLPSLLGCLVLLAKFLPSTVWNPMEFRISPQFSLYPFAWASTGWASPAKEGGGAGKRTRRDAASFISVCVGK